MTDGLTGLFNRRHFDEALRSALSFAGRQGQPMSLILLDVDHFKSYNDSLGHLAGDDVLRTVAEVLRSHSRAHDVVARYGGEEFALVLPATDACGARILAERLRAAIASHHWPHRPVTASFGLATTTALVPDALAMIAEADLALYASKARGRDRVTHNLDMGQSGTKREPLLGLLEPYESTRVTSIAPPVLLKVGQNVIAYACSKKAVP